MLPVIVTNSFNISLYALFIAILIPNLKRSKTITLMVIITGILNYLLQFVIGNWSLIVATLIGAIIGIKTFTDKSKWKEKDYSNLNQVYVATGGGKENFIADEDVNKILTKTYINKKYLRRR